MRAVACLLLLLLLSPAVVQAETFHSPTINGKPVDRTTWDYKSTQINESPYRQRAANAFCRDKGYVEATGFTVGEQQTRGTWRYNADGSSSACDFCQWIFTSITCGTSPVCGLSSYNPADQCCCCLSATTTTARTCSPKDNSQHQSCYYICDPHIGSQGTR